MQNYGYYKRRYSGGRLPATGAGVSGLMKVVDILMLILTVVCSLLLLMAYFGTIVSPQRIWWLAFPGLIFPILYVVELVCLLWWVIRWSKYAIGVAAVLLLGVGIAGAFYRPEMKKQYSEAKPSKSEIVILTYNVMNFNPRLSKSSGGSTAEEIGEFINGIDVDIVCMQEFFGLTSHSKIDESIKEFKYKRYQSYNPDGDKPSDKYASGLKIFSRYPIIDNGFLPPAEESEDTRMSTMWVDIRIKRDTVRVFNNHLRSTHIDNTDIDYLSSLKFVGDEEKKPKTSIKDIVRKLRDNYIHRAPQAIALAKAVKESPYPVIVCGDFNDTPASFAYHRASRRLQDAFIKRGHGTDGTYNRFFNMFRIDYIMMSKQLNIVGYYPFDIRYSDHTPVAAGFEFNGK